MHFNEKFVNTFGWHWLSSNIIEIKRDARGGQIKFQCMDSTSFMNEMVCTRKPEPNKKTVIVFEYSAPME